MLRITQFGALLLALLATSACAPEQSKEDKQREENRREEARLNKAAGSFVGYVAIDADRVVPATLTNRVQRNPSDGSDKPRLRSELVVGFFGGVRLSTSQTSYDHGAGSFSAVFDQAAQTRSLQGSGGAGIPVEFRAKLSDRTFGEGTLDTVTGRYVMEMSAGDPSTFMMAANQYQFSVRASDDAGDTAGLLTMKRLPEDVASPSGYDLPVQPALEVSMHFLGSGPVRNEAQSVSYNPIGGLLEILFADQSRLVYNDVFLPRGFALDQLGRSLPALEQGALFYSGSQVATLVTQEEGALDGIKDTYPPRHYYGTLQPRKNGPVYDLVAEIEPTGEELSNEGDAAFKDFPELQMTVFACLDGVLIDKRVFSTYNFDQLAKIVRVRDGNAIGTEEKDIEFKISGSWETIKGRFLAEGGAAGEDRSTIALTAAPKSFTREGCAITSLANKDEDDDFPDDGVLEFNGHLERGGDNEIPAKIMIYPRRQQGSEDPSLQVTLKLGFFGGASLASEPAYFDWGTGEVIASFARPEGAALEFRTTLQTDVIDDARLLGPNLGVNRIFGTSTGIDYFEEEDDSTFYDITIPPASGNPGGVTVDAVLAMKREREDSPAPANIDLPSLPSLKASMKLAGLAQTPQVSNRVIYDPLRGRIEIKFTESSKIEFNDLFLEPVDGGYAIPEEVIGDVVLGATSLRTISARETETETVVSNLPPRNFIGTYQGRPGALQMKAIGSVVYLQGEGQNTSEFPFPSFPRLEITVTICAGSEPLARRRNELTSIDHLSFSALFSAPTGSNQDDLFIWYDQDWSELEGVYIDPETPSTGIDRENVQLRFQEIGSLSARICDTPLP